MKNKILVTGGSGLVGMAIQSLVGEYPDFEFIFINSKDCNLIHFEETFRFFESIKPDYIIHLAANVGGLFKNLENQVDMLETNLMINLNVIKCARLLQINRILSCLSTCVFPADISYPIIEEFLHDGPPDQSNQTYAYSKRILDVHSKACNNSLNTNYSSIIPCNIYGSHDNYDLKNAHVIPALIHSAYLAKQNNTPFVVKGTGTPLRQFIYSIDLAKIIMKLLFIDQTESLIISPPEDHEVSIGYIAELIAKEFGIKLSYDNSYSDGQYKKTVSNKKLISVIGDYSFTPLELGIISSINWFKDNYYNKIIK